MPSHLMIVVSGLLALSTPQSPIPWDQAVQSAAFQKKGIAALNAPHYQFGILGLGGTTMRVGPHGFTRPGAPGVPAGGYLTHLPYLAYQYWWDEQAHRHIPFDLTGGYGEAVDPGAIATFDHVLDIATGVLDIGLRLKVGDGTPFDSRRELFITPDGVLVIRVEDGPGAPLPFRLRVDTNQEVRIYLNIGVYDRPHAPWSGSAVAREEGLVVEATRPETCVATLAIAVDAADAQVDERGMTLGPKQPGATFTCYIAPGSSYEGSDPAAAAWSKADRARARGFDAVKADTAGWWKAFYDRSGVDLPDADLARWYARSVYYQGVYYGNTDIPPGCNGTSVEGFAGAICPEYDLVLDQMALLYTGRFDESRGVADWLARVLPRAERYAVEGTTMHNVTLTYTGGAKYHTLMGYDGTLCVQPGEVEGVNVYRNYPGANAALMALAHADWTLDRQYLEQAKRILRQTTQVSLEDLDWREDFQAYVNRNAPSTVQQAATEFGLRESLARGVAEDAWRPYEGKILRPSGDLDGRPVFVVGAGGAGAHGQGDSTWMVPLWWYGNVPMDDPRARPTYEMVRGSKTGDYVFNNGWVGVIAAKLGEGEEAYGWVRNLLRPGVTLYDDTCFTEIVYNEEDFKKTPEIAAHSALISNTVHMLMDGDSASGITVFPALPEGWRRDGVAFERLRARGALAVSGAYRPDGAQVSVENRSEAPATRTLKVRLYGGLVPDDANTVVEGGYAVVPELTLLPGKTVTFAFRPAAATPTEAP